MPVTAAERLDRFRREAESTAKRSILIEATADLGPNNGTTECNSTEIVIKVKSGVSQELHDNVLAHELGHALLCGMGFPMLQAGIPATNLLHPSDETLRAVANTIPNCYLDPLADEEARRRGFDPSVTVDDSAKKTQMTEEEVRYNGAILGFDWSKYMALTIYCSEKRRHSFSESDYERTFLVDPILKSTLESLRTELNSTDARSPSSFFETVKQLRDVAGFRGVIFLKNPETQHIE